MLVFFNPIRIDDTTSNGGRIGNVPILDASKNALSPDITFAESKAGLTRYRKAFGVPGEKIPLLYLFFDPSIFLLHIGTDTDTQAEADDYTEWKGTGLLKTALTAGDVTTITVTGKIAGVGFNILDVIRISDGTDTDFVRAQSVSWAGSTATITCMAGSRILHDYSAGAYISACVEVGSAEIVPVWTKEVVPAYTGPQRNEFLYLKGAY